MITENLEQILTAHPFFSGMRPEHLQLLAGCASNAHFEAGQFVLRQGQEADKCFLIRYGKVSLEVYAPERGAIEIQTLGEGDILGWSWLVPPHRWRLDARAIEMTRAIVLDGKRMREECESDHELGYELLQRFNQVMAENLESLRFQLLNVYATA